VTAATRLIALLGDPVSHSLSPLFQNAAIRAAGLDAVYLALRCAPGDLAGLLRGIALAGGGGNVTLPHKAMAAAALDRRTAAVELTGACNCFWSDEGLVHGDNTDVEGVLIALRELMAEGAQVRRVLLLGAGGAAAAVLAALPAVEPREVRIANRDPVRARALARRFASAHPPVEVGPSDGSWDLIINATPLGLHPGQLPPVGSARFGAALDLAYAPGGTHWVTGLRERGVPARDGQTMLLHQGAAAFRRWFGREPELEVMRAALAGETPAAPER
jgi:shikimate dehydrogenase